MTKKRMGALHFDNHLIADVSALVQLHLRFHGYVDEPWTDAAVRRYVKDAGHLYHRLNRLTRADATTQNNAKEKMFAFYYCCLFASLISFPGFGVPRGVQPLGRGSAASKQRQFSLRAFFCCQKKASSREAAVNSPFYTNFTQHLPSRGGVPAAHTL